MDNQSLILLKQADVNNYLQISNKILYFQQQINLSKLIHPLHGAKQFIGANSLCAKIRCKFVKKV